MSKIKKGNAIPTKFDAPEESLILALNQRTGLSQGEVVRRAVRLLRREIAHRGSSWVNFLVEELAPETTKPMITYNPGEEGLRAAETPTVRQDEPVVAQLSKAAAKFNKTKKRQAARKRAA